MTEKVQNTIWTIGHSTRDLISFHDLLTANGINVLADIRTLPGSRKYPHFNQENLVQSLAQLGIEYIHFPELGGRRKPKAGSQNTAWRNVSFQGYADHMETSEFMLGIERLQQLAREKHVAYMCSELVWWRCHRSLVSDYLKINGWRVLHILDKIKIQEHPYTGPARPVQGKLFYN